MPLIFATHLLVLRPFHRADRAPCMAYRSGPDTAPSHAWEPYHVHHAAAFLHDLQQIVPGTWYQRAITLTARGTMIGACAVCRLAANRRHAEIGAPFAP